MCVSCFFINLKLYKLSLIILWTYFFFPDIILTCFFLKKFLMGSHLLTKLKWNVFITYIDHILSDQIRMWNPLFIWYWLYEKWYNVRLHFLCRLMFKNMFKKKICKMIFLLLAQSILFIVFLKEFLKCFTAFL